MGKTLRYSHEGEDYGWQDHRVPQRDVYLTNHRATLPLMRLLPPVRCRPKEASGRLQEPAFVPDREVARRQPPEWYDREQRLDLIQTLGEQMLQTPLDP